MQSSLRDLRDGLGVTQAQMAQAMGVPIRTYEDLENGRSTIRPIHTRAASFAAIKFAAEEGGYDRLPFDLGELVTRAAKKKR